jgi:hypothetical protein
LATTCCKALRQRHDAPEQELHRAPLDQRPAREAGGLPLLSAYINHSIRNDRESIWIAQAEGRAKDGDDRTDSAILKMFHMSRKDEPFGAVIQSLNLIPVSISYEYDPATRPRPASCTSAPPPAPKKARRGRQQHRQGHYRLQGPGAHQLRRRAGE